MPSAVKATEVKTMCEFLDRVEARGEARGVAIGEAKAKKRFIELLKSGKTKEEILAECSVR